MRFCRKFLRMSPRRKEELIERHRYCVNCLARSHDLRSCTSLDTCKRCDRFHHTLLHPRPQRPGRQARTTQRPITHQPPRRAENPATNPQATQREDNQPTTSAASGTKILLEAIKSLAQVLCSSDETPAVV